MDAIGGKVLIEEKNSLNRDDAGHVKIGNDSVWGGLFLANFATPNGHLIHYDREYDGEKSGDQKGTLGTRGIQQLSIFFYDAIVFKSGTLWITSDTTNSASRKIDGRILIPT